MTNVAARPNPARRVCRTCVAVWAALLSLTGLMACNSSAPGVFIVPIADGGTADAAAGAVEGGGAGAFATAASPSDLSKTCSSDVYWTRGDVESPLMHPGRACIDCHSSSDEGPALSIAGTVYPTAHEPNDCNGVEGANDVQVVITDAAGNEVVINVNAAGNFSTARPIEFPFHAKVVTMGQERAMSAAQMTGDCNSCHTETGANGSPGRIMLP